MTAHPVGRPSSLPARPSPSVARPSSRCYRLVWGTLMLVVVGLLVARLPAVEQELELRLQGAEAPPEARTLDPTYTELALRSGSGAALAISIIVSLVMLTIAMRVAARTRGAGSVSVAGAPIPLVLLVVAPVTVLAHLSRLLGLTSTVATAGLVLAALAVAGGAVLLVQDHRWRWPARLALAVTCALVFALF